MWGLHPDYFDALFAGVVIIVPLLLGVYVYPLATCLATHPTPGPGVTALLQLLAAAGRWLGLASGAASVPGERARLRARRRHLGLVYTLATLAVATYLANLYLAEAVIFE